MTKLAGSQLSLIAESDFEDRPVGDWEFDELGTDKISVPNFQSSKLGTGKILVPNFPSSKLGTEKILVPNFPSPKLGTENQDRICESNWVLPDYSDWKPPIGCIDRKWIKDHQYWCWRYYDLQGTKRSIHLHKDYNKAVRKAIKIGMPSDAKLPKSTVRASDPQSPAQFTENIIDIAQTAHSASRDTRAA